MKINLKKWAIALIVTLLALPAWAETSPKREHRAAWVTTAWGMCWPSTTGTTSAKATSQKNEAIGYLDLMQENGFNAVYFQVRSMCDAMYASSYEPWSSYVSGSRGSKPAYDPLEFWVSECHKRGMECYAWVNPYRYESSISGSPWDGTNDYRTTNPGWLLEYNNMSILNPGIEAVQQRIVDVCKEIISNYDVDGLVFDDYFYLNSIPESYDAAQYSASGTTMSQADWRRENVNTMVRKVYNMVQSVKPYVKFGISPAGVSKVSASKYGISTSEISSASDWQYSQIFSDPLAWLSEQTVDFISPQLYWLESHSTNSYSKLAKWWSDACANVFERHFYSSHSISFLAEANANTEANWAEITGQIQSNRDADTQNAPGSVLFGSRDFTGRRNSGLAPYIKANKFQNLALPPAMTWKSATDPGVVSNMALIGTTLSWTGVDNMRYAVYAVPTGIDPGTDVSSDYLIGNPYEATFDVSGYTSGYQLGVSIVDRHSNEYTVVWLGSSSTIEQLETVTLSSPTSGSTTAESFTFSWSAISGATYTLEISTSSAFSTVNFSKTTTATSVASSSFNLAAGTTYYWRVKATKDGYIGSTSAVNSFTTYSDNTGSGGTTTELIKDPATYSAAGNYTIESQWIYSVNTNNFPSTLGGDQRSMTAYNGNIYITHRDGYLYEYSGTTGEYLRKIALTGDYATSSSGTSLSYKCNDIFVDGAGNLCISNMTTNASTQPLTVCTVNLSTGATTRVFESSLSSSLRFDYAAAYGDVTSAGGQIWAAVANAATVYKWTRNSSGSWTAYGTTIGSYYTNAGNAVSTNSTAPRIMPISDTEFILDGHNSAPTRYTFVRSGTATLSDSFANNTGLAPTADNWNGLCNGTVSGQTVFAYVSAIGPNKFNIVTNPSNFDFSEMEMLWTVPESGLGSATNGYVSSQPATISNADGSMTLFLYTPNNGLAAYKLTYTGSTEEPVEDLEAVTLTAPSNGTTTTDGFNFSWSAIEGATYTIEVATNTTFTDIVATATSTTNSYSSSNFSLATGTTYYWRVKASKEGYNSSTSSTFSFKTATPDLDAVTLISPTAGTTVSESFNFSWSEISGATYTLEVSTSASFSTVNFTATTTATSYSSSNFALAANTTYYWRVTAAVSGYNSSTTDPQAFTTPMETLAAVSLTSPVGGATVAESFNFSWSAISGATYTIEISSLASFATIMFTTETTETSLASSTFDFVESTKYYWRIIATKNGYNSSTSATESFVTPTATVETPNTPVTGLPTDGATYEVKSGLKIINLWTYTINNGNFPEQLGRDQRGMAAYNGNVYVSERADGTGYLIEFDGKTGEYLRTITLTGDYLTLSSGSTLGYPCNDVFVDGGGHLCVSNMVASFHSTGQITICTVDVSTGATTRVFESSLSNISVRMDHCMVWGDITQSGAKVYGAASNAATSSSYKKRIYCWTRDDSGNWTSTYQNARSLYPSTQSTFGNAPRVLPIDGSRFIVDGSTTYPTLYKFGNSRASIVDDFDSNSSIMPNGMLSAGMCTGEVDGKPLYIYAYDDSEIDFYDFAIVYNPSDFDYGEMELLWTVPQNGLGNVAQSFVSAIPATVNNADGTMTLYVYVPNNGLAAYLIADEAWTAIEEIESDNNTSCIRVINRIAYVSEQAEVINVYSTSGAIVATASNCNTINLAALPAGVYVINAQNGDISIVERVVIK